jgi:hypothetical protein
MTLSDDLEKPPEKQTGDSLPKDASVPTHDTMAPKPAQQSVGYPKPDWRPLGAVRDYFAEQLRQDQYR